MTSAGLAKERSVWKAYVVLDNDVATSGQQSKYGPQLAGLYESFFWRNNGERG
jgi:hypothetical protein